MRVFTVDLDEKDLAALKIAAAQKLDADGKQWSTGRLIRYILNSWLGNQAKKKIAK